MDLIKLKHGEEAEFEEELNGKPAVQPEGEGGSKAIAKKSSSVWKTGKSTSAQRLSALRELPLDSGVASHDPFSDRVKNSFF